MRLLFLTDFLLHQFLLIQLYCKGFWQWKPHVFLPIKNVPLLTGQGSCIIPLVFMVSSYIPGYKRGCWRPHRWSCISWLILTKKIQICSNNLFWVVKMHDLLFHSTDLGRKNKGQKKSGSGWLWYVVLDLVRLWVSLLQSVQRAWVCFCAGSIGSISVWGPVVGSSHTVAPRRAKLPPEFSHFQSHDSSVCPSVCLPTTKACDLLHYVLLLPLPFLSLSGVAPRLVCYYPFPTLSKEDKACD